ncbi:hypothetical protein M422DRAFT_251628 [Sphaerobolus stellatus SS14]|uniref:Uncharacterized protein n=1 Tax=Sphaerobolus stellatus (strain SS14) TaxID=990650 RepID=A0A0C9VDA3_SPHS4|nr:hypothetical protein M422DRAFT_251628 [Sphaerobolus stellatus SS14]
MPPTTPSTHLFEQHIPDLVTKLKNDCEYRPSSEIKLLKEELDPFQKLASPVQDAPQEYRRTTAATTVLMADESIGEHFISFNSSEVFGRRTINKREGMRILDKPDADDGTVQQNLRVTGRTRNIP